MKFALLGIVLLAASLVDSYRFAAPSGPVVFDATAGATVGGSALTLEWNHTCTGNDRVLFVGLTWIVYPGAITSVTYNGVAMTELWDTGGTDGVAGNAGYILVNPATGTNAIVATCGAAVDSVIAGASVSFTNCNTSSPTGTPVITEASTGADGSVTVTDVGSNDMVVNNHNFYGSAIIVGADQTSRQGWDNALFNALSTSVSTQPGSSGGVMSSTHSSGYWTAGAVAIKPKP